MIKICIRLLILAALTHNAMHADEVITLFLQPYPILEDQAYAQEFSGYLRDLGTIAHHTMHGIAKKNITAGIFSTYAGYLHVSDYNGQIIFPRKQEKPLMYIAITTRITPNIISGNTIHHWEFEAGTPTDLYSVERKKDKDTSATYWDVQKVEKLPENMVILDETIVIFARPKYIYVPTGITVTNDKPNFVLPPIYVKKGIKVTASTLYVLKIKQYFAQVDPLFKKFESGLGYSEIVGP